MNHEQTLAEFAQPAGNFPSSSLTKREAFRSGYIEGMTFANITAADEDIETTGIAGWELSDAAIKTLTAQADEFLDADTVSLIERACETGHYDYGDAGQDFALTRNHHGAGFWDRGLPDTIGEDLTEIAHGYGEAWIYADSDDPTKWIVEGN